MTIAAAADPQSAWSGVGSCCDRAPGEQEGYGICSAAVHLNVGGAVRLSMPAPASTVEKRFWLEIERSGPSRLPYSGTFPCSPTPARFPPGYK